MNLEPIDDESGTTRSADESVPNTRAPRSGEPPAAGRISPAEKSEPTGVPIEEQEHNADPNAPQTQVSAPGATQHPPGESPVPASSLRQGPDDGTDEARRRAQVTNARPPEDS
jgi:hypothetical protein